MFKLWNLTQEEKDLINEDITGSDKYALWQYRWYHEYFGENDNYIKLYQIDADWNNNFCWFISYYMISGGRMATIEQVYILNYSLNDWHYNMNRKRWHGKALLKELIDLIPNNCVIKVACIERLKKFYGSVGFKEVGVQKWWHYVNDEFDDLYYMYYVKGNVEWYKNNF